MKRDLEKILTSLSKRALTNSVRINGTSYSFSVALTVENGQSSHNESYVIELDFSLQAQKVPQIVCSISIEGYEYLSKNIAMSSFAKVHHELSKKKITYDAQVTGRDQSKARSKADRCIKALLNN